MAINERLRHAASDAWTRLADAERDLQLARAACHQIVRRMHLAGASCREISQVLGLSHQRVQQMIQGAGGTWWNRIWSPRRLKGNLKCTFCGRSQDVVARLIAGPKVFICDACVGNAAQSLAGVQAQSGFRSPVGENSRIRCSFCRKGRTESRTMLASSQGNICGECLDLCRQILFDTDPAEDPRR